MPHVETDDSANRNEFIYRGPPGFEFPFEARGKTWLRGVVLAVAATFASGMALAPLLMLAMPPGLAVIAAAVLAVVVGALIGGMAAMVLGSWDTPTTPLRYRRAVIRREASSDRPRHTAGAGRVDPESVTPVLPARVEGHITPRSSSEHQHRTQQHGRIAPPPVSPAPHPPDVW